MAVSSFTDDGDPREWGRQSIVIDVDEGKPNQGSTSSSKRRRTKEKRPKKPEQAVVLPERVVVPTMGSLGRLYRRNKSNNHPERIPHLRPDLVTPTGWAQVLQMAHLLGDVPQLSKREQKAIAVRRAQLQVEYEQAFTLYKEKRLDNAIIALSDMVPTQRVCVINTKGDSSNTTTLVNMTSVHGSITHRSVIAADFNLASGNMGRRLGRDFGQTLTLGELVRSHAEIQAFRDFIVPIRPTQYDVRVVSANNIIEKGQAVSSDDIWRVMEALYRFTEYLYMDTLNFITDPVALANVDFSDVIVFTANVGEQESLRQLGTSMETLRRHGFEDKVNNSVVCISNIPEGKWVNDYRDYLDIVDENDQVVTKSSGNYRGKLVGIPHDPSLKPALPVNLEKLQPETLMCYKALVIATLKQNPKYWNNPSESEVPETVLGTKPVQETIEGFEFFEPEVANV